MLEYRQLALVGLEIEDLPRLGVLAGQVVIHLALEFLPRHRSGFVHPGCTIEPLSVPPSHLGQLPRLGPSDQLQFPLADWSQVLVDGHQVVGLASGFRELPLQELVERTDVVHPPVLSCPNLAEIAAEFDELRIPFSIGGLLPSQDLVDLREYKHGTPAIELRSHQSPSVSRQAHQANQGRSLPVDE